MLLAASSAATLPFSSADKEALLADVDEQGNAESELQLADSENSTFPPEDIFGNYKKIRGGKRRRGGKHGGGRHGKLLQYCLGGGNCFTLNDVTVYPVYWGTNWASISYQLDVLTSNEHFYSHLTNTPYLNVLNQYFNGATGSVSFGQNFVVTSSSHMTQREIQARTGQEACRLAQQNGITNSNSYFPVFVDWPRGGAQFCAFHSAINCRVNGKDVYLNFGFFFDLRNDNACTVGPRNTKGRSQAAANLANVGMHELIETMTDPGGHGWHTTGPGYEIGDLCEAQIAPITLNDGSSYVIQAEYSDAAGTCVWK